MSTTLVHSDHYELDRYVNYSHMYMYFNAPLYINLSAAKGGFPGAPLTNLLLSRLYGSMNGTLERVQR